MWRATDYYRFLFLFHSGGHFWHRPIDRGQVFEVRDIFLNVYGHRLDGVERPRPERELGRHCDGDDGRLPLRLPSGPGTRHQATNSARTSSLGGRRPRWHGHRAVLTWGRSGLRVFTYSIFFLDAFYALSFRNSIWWRGKSSPKCMHRISPACFIDGASIQRPFKPNLRLPTVFRGEARVFCSFFSTTVHHHFIQYFIPFC